jgi:nucleoid DNA-binding protein
VTKSELVLELMNKAAHVSQKDMALIVDTIFDRMVDSLRSGDRNAAVAIVLRYQINRQKAN